MGSNSPNHSFYLPDPGEDSWGTAKNNDWSDVDTRLIIKDTSGNRPAAGTAGRWFLATDTLDLYYDDGASWNDILAQVGNADTLDGLHRSDFARNVRTFKVDSGSGTEYFKVGKISDGGQFEQGRFSAILDFATDNASSSPRRAVVFGAVRASSYGLKAYAVGSGGNDHVDLLVTETSGTGTNGENEYYLYARSDDFCQTELTVKYNQSFGSFDFTGGLTQSDLIGTVVADTANPNADPRYGDIRQNGNLVLDTSDEGSLDAGTLDGYDSAAFGALGEAETVTGAWTFDASFTQGRNPSETITETSSPTSFNFSGTTERDIHDSTDVTISNGTTSSVTEDVTVELYDGSDTTGTLVVSETQSVTVSASSTTTVTFITAPQSLDTGTYHIEVSTSGTTLTIDQTDEHTSGATYEHGQTATGGGYVRDQYGRDVFTLDPITDDVDVPNGTLSNQGNAVLTTADEGTLDAGTLDGYDSADFAALGEAETVTNNWTFSSPPAMDAGTGNDSFFYFKENGNNRVALWYDPADDSYKVYHYGYSGYLIHGLSDGTVQVPSGSLTLNGNPAVSTTQSGGYEIQKNGTDGTGVINFKT